MTLVEWITDPSLYNIAVFYSKSLATRLKESRVDTSLRQLDSMRVYWTTLNNEAQAIYKTVVFNSSVFSVDNA